MVMNIVFCRRDIYLVLFDDEHTLCSLTQHELHQSLQQSRHCASVALTKPMACGVVVLLSTVHQ